MYPASPVTLLQSPQFQPSLHLLGFLGWHEMLHSLHLQWKGNESWRRGITCLCFSGTCLGYRHPSKVVRGLWILRLGIFWVGSLYPKETRLQLMMVMVALLLVWLSLGLCPEEFTCAQMHGAQVATPDFFMSPGSRFNMLRNSRLLFFLPACSLWYGVS